MQQKLYTYNLPFHLESGATLVGIEIAYHTYGVLNKDKSNVVWICHALTANSDAAGWWHGLVGNGKFFDPEKYFIICANILGSCYGSSGPLSKNPETGKRFFSNFPQVTIRDMVNAHILLKRHLGIEKIHIGSGGSMGAYQLMEWELMEKGAFNNLVLLCTCARETAWGIAIHTAQRLAIEADATWKEDNENAGAKGLKAARATGILTYRNYETFLKTQTDDDFSKSDNFRASSYILYQGEKLVNRFNAYSYWLLTKAMDSHNIARNRGSIEDVLRQIGSNALIIGIKSDILCPVAEQKFLASTIPCALYQEIDSLYGHDGFLIEWEQLAEMLGGFIK